MKTIKIDEIEISKTVLENMSGNKISCFSYPFGKINELSANLVNKSYHFAVSTMRSRFDTNKHKKLWSNCQRRYGIRRYTSNNV